MEPPDVGTVSWYPQMSRYPQIFQPLVSPPENRENLRIRYPQIFGGGPALWGKGGYRQERKPGLY